MGVLRPRASATIAAIFLAALPAHGESFATEIRPLLEQHCMVCHGPQLQMAELRFDQFSDEAEALRYPAVWDDVLRVTREGKMPPAGSPKPDQEQLDALSAWVRANRHAMERHRSRTVRAVTARRLNREEYNNTVRDLLAVDLRPADSFPVDDSGYGFDNIGDVLSVSPLLMEKYVDAAERLAEEAVWSEPRTVRPTRFRIQAARDPGNSSGIGRVARFTVDGSIRVMFDFRATGFYELAFGAVDRRQRSEDNQRYLPDLDPPPRLMTLRMDGTRMATKAVEAAQYFDRNERVTHRIDAGSREIWVGFIDHKGSPMNPNALFSQRKLWVDYLEINGPFDAEPVPLPLSHRRIIACLPDGEEPWEPCARRIIRQLATRAFRRPATAQELARLEQLATLSMKSGESFEGMVQTVLQAVLVSPQFLFRIESQSSGESPRPLGDFELASRLSYFLWSTMPDQELFEVAASGNLVEPDELVRQVRRMLADERSETLVDNFGGQWLQLRNLAHSQPDGERFPEFNDALRNSMLQESRRFFAAILREDRSVLDFLDADFTFVNDVLARHYGIAGVDGPEFRRVPVSDGRRGSLLGQSAILTLSSYPTRTSPVQRGLWVMETILGQAPPPPPPDVPELEVREGEIHGTLREQLELHRADPGCMSCHLVMDALGFGLENYDAVGKWRTTEGGSAVDASGELPGGRSFESPADLRRMLRGTESRSFVRTLTKKLLTFALGRGVDRHDNPAIDAIVERSEAADHRLSSIIEAIVTSDLFRTTGPQSSTGRNAD